MANARHKTNSAAVTCEPDGGTGDGKGDCKKRGGKPEEDMWRRKKQGVRVL